MKIPNYISDIDHILIFCQKTGGNEWSWSFCFNLINVIENMRDCAENSKKKHGNIAVQHTTYPLN